MARQRVVKLLAGVPRVTVESASSGPDHYVLIDTQDEQCAHLARELVLCADPKASLTHECTGPSLTMAGSGALVGPIGVRAGGRDLAG